MLLAFKQTSYTAKPIPSTLMTRVNYKCSTQMEGKCGGM